MNRKSIYDRIEEAKNGTRIPVFSNGHTMESRYNPQRDAENLCNNIIDGSFFVVIGIGSGIFIKSLLQKLNSKSTPVKIIAVEKSADDLDFLSDLETVRELLENHQVILCHSENLSEVLTQNYLPAKYGNLQIIEQRGWVNENTQTYIQIKEILKKTLSIISADYSVQAHFGKIWVHNIMNNARLLRKTSNHEDCFCRIQKAAAENKTAVIIAAGPSLDSMINQLADSNMRKNLFIISTDTAWQSLSKYGINADAVVSIDGQSVSYNHFIKNIKDKSLQAEDFSSPLFFFDLCANTSALKYITENDFPVILFSSGHPLSTAINNFSGNALPFLFSGAGTVTITALDLALRSGFKNIKILGADFSYSNGKPYTKGTYLDSLYNFSAEKINCMEKTFTKLMYRTPLTDYGNGHFSSAVLEAYKTSLENYLNENRISFSCNNFVYELKVPQNVSNLYQSDFTYLPHKFNYENFIEELKKSEAQTVENLLMPYIAYLRQKSQLQNQPYNELLKLALGRIVSYNI